MLTARDGPVLPGDLRQHNRLTILRQLRRAGPITKPALANLTGISRPTVTKVVDDLEREGLVEAAGIEPPYQNGGKSGVLYRFRASEVLSVALFLRVDTLYAALIDGNATIRQRAEYPLGDARDPDAVLALMVTALPALLAQAQVTPGELLGVGVGVPGLTSYHTGIVHFAPHLPGWRDVPLGTLLAQQLHLPVWVDNDCHVQALAERHFGAGQDVSSFVSVQSGIGLSAGLFQDGALIRGAFNSAGEIGHMVMQADGPPCHCGKRGCWETLASTERLVLNACASDEHLQPPDWLEVPQAGVGSIDADQPLPPTLVASYAQAIFAAARQGQPEAIQLVMQHAQQFGAGISHLISILDPQRIIIWGADVAAGDLFLITVRSVVRHQALRRGRELCDIQFSALDQDVGLIGAASLALDALLEGAL